MPDPDPTPARPRHGTGQLATDWGAKSDELLVKKPFFQRSWFRRLVFGLGCAAGLALLLPLWKLNAWHTERRLEAARAQRDVAAFVGSREFASFGRAADAQLLAVLNFAVAQPGAARDALPSVAAWEHAHGVLPWALEASSLPVSAANRPDRIVAAGREIARLLARRSFAFDEAARRDGRHLFLRLLAPYARAFQEGAPDHSVGALWEDRSLQELALAAYGARSGTAAPRAEAERLFAFYALLGPRMWTAIEQGSDPAGRPAPPP